MSTLDINRHFSMSSSSKLSRRKTITLIVGWMRSIYEFKTKFLHSFIHDKIKSRLSKTM
jgi:hypothetical protein